MGYHIGMTTIQRVEKYLLLFLESKEQTVVFKMKKVRNTVHLLRQAFKNCQLAQNKYQHLRDIWTVKEQTDCIICVRKSTVEEPSLVSVVEEIKEAGVPFPSAIRIEEVVGICLENRHRVITFPKYIPNSGELLILERWGEQCHVVFHYTDNLLTARPANEQK